MIVKNIMTLNPICCAPETPLEDVVQMMIALDCSEFTVVENLATNLPIGLITSRDIIRCLIIKGLNSSKMTVSECMSQSFVTVKPEDSIEKCLQVMEANKVQRVPVVDAGGTCIGIASLKAIAKNLAKKHSAEFIHEVAKTATAASNFN